MVLTNEQLRATLRGTVEIAEENGILVPYRFGRYVRENVYGVGNPYHSRMDQTSGIVSTFRTDSATLSFRFTSASVTGTQSFDVYADGVMLSHTPLTANEGVIEVALPTGEKTVTIYFPYATRGRIFDVTLADGATFGAAPAARYRILFIGDSITHGGEARFSSMPYAHGVARILDAEIVNQGVSGAGFEPTAVDMALEGEFDLISVSYGTNDWSHCASHPHFVGVVNGHLAALRDRYPNTPIAMILPLWRADYTRTDKKVGSFEDARRAMCEAAARFDVIVVDGVQLVPNMCSMMADNRLHPSDFGYQFYAENLATRFEEILGK